MLVFHIILWGEIQTQHRSYLFFSCSRHFTIILGQRHNLNDPAYRSINSLWNHQNYWLNNEVAEEWKLEKNLELSNGQKWIKFVCDMELAPKKESQEDSPKRLLNNLHSWLMELVIPRDCFELMYRLGQKTSEFKNVNVEFFAQYLLKDGMVQRVTQVKDENAKDQEESEQDSEDEDYEEDLYSFQEKVESEPDPEDDVEADQESVEGSDIKSGSIKEPEKPKTPSPKPIIQETQQERMMYRRPPQVVHILEKFRHRSDKMTIRETFPTMEKVVERFANGRKDRLLEHEFYKVGAAILGGEAEDISKYYDASRLDGLTKRVWKDMELIEEYVGRPDRLIHMHVQFVQVEKKFGPAGDTGKSAREIGKIVETYEMHKDHKAEEDEDQDYDDGYDSFSPGRILDTRHGIMERTYDIDGRRILLKFHREKGQVRVIFQIWNGNIQYDLPFSAVSQICRKVFTE